MKTRLKLLIYILSFVLLYAIYYWIVPVVVNIDARMPAIQKIIKKELGCDIAIKNPSLKMGLSPSIWLDASNLEILDKNNLSPLSVKNPRIKVNLLPLFIGKIQLAYFSCDKINADLKIDKHSRFYIGNYLIISNSNPKVSLENSKMSINSYQVHFKDELNSKDFFLEGDYFNLLEYNSNEHIKFSTNSKLKANNHSSIINADIGFHLPLKKSFNKNNINFTGTVANLNLADFSPYIRNFSKNKIKGISGIVNIQAKTNHLNVLTDRITSQVVVKDLNIIGKDKPSSVIFKDKLKILTVLDISKNTLQIQKIQLLSKRINANVSGSVSKISSKNPVLHLSVTIKKSRIEDFIALIPATKASKENLNPVALKKYGYYSDLDGTLYISGKSDKPYIKGEIVASDGYVIKPLPSGIAKSTVKLTFLGEKMIMDILVPVEKNEKIKINGYVELYDKKRSNFDITSTSNFDLKNAQAVLIPLQEIFNLELGPIPFMKIEGVGNINLKIKGNKFDPHLFGEFKFRNATASFNDIAMLLEKSTGKLKFNDKDTSLTTSAFFNNKPIKIDGKCSLFGVLEYNVTANNQDLGSLLGILQNSPILADIEKYFSSIKDVKGNSDLTLKITGKIENVNKIAFGKTIFASGKIKLLGNDILLNKLQVPIKNVFGDIDYKDSNWNLNLYSYINKDKINLIGKIKDNKATLKLDGDLKNNHFSASSTIQNIAQKNQTLNGSLIADNFDIATLNDLTKSPFISDSTKKQMGNFSNLAGRINLKAYIKNNVCSSKIKLNGISFAYSPEEVPIKFFSGVAELKNDKLIFYKVNAAIDSMPILIDGIINDIFKTPNFNVYINSKPTQKFIETYINKNAIYPLKIKGDIIYASRIIGTKDFFKARTEINLQEDSNIYYMGSTLGDVNDPIRVFLNVNVAKNVINVVDFQYDKLISSQNNKEFVSPQLNAKGYIRVDGKNIYLRNFRIKTQNPTDAKIFNMLFKKPMIKQGLFNSNIVINGLIGEPYIVGDVTFTGIDIPLLDTTIKDVSLDFDDKKINIKSTGEVFSNKIIASAVMKNELKPPYVFDDIDIYFENLDVNAITKSLDKLSIESDKNKITNQKQDIDISNIVIKNAKLKADKILVKNIDAKNLLAKISLNEKLLFSMDNFRFEVAEGKVDGIFKYNLLNSATKLDMNIDNVNANLMADALFDLPNQLYGSLTGNVNLTCNGKTHKSCMETLNGNGGFKVARGRMPKLGSLEYLLKASNLVKSGITGLSINGIIDLVTPVKTGEFESIQGDFLINSGIANSINIFSRGEDLSMFLTGTYNFSTLVADLDVFGRLSKKISTVFGLLGNTSLNTLFNTIPGLNLDEANNAQIIKSINKIPGFELNDKLYRVFSVKIYGDINGENYVQSFQWVE